MLKTTLTGINVSGRICNQLTFNVSNNPLSVQSVRWRKPIALGTAKSKLFRVPPRRRQEPEERAELFRITANYKTLMRSLQAHFMQQNALRSEELAAVSISAVEERDFALTAAINDVWNAEVAKNRENRVEKERAERETYILTRLDAMKEREDRERLRVDELVRKEIEALKTYILPENLDAAIEYSLTHPVDFNFAIDLKGHIYRGRTSNTNEKPKDQESEWANQ